MCKKEMGMLACAAALLFVCSCARQDEPVLPDSGTSAVAPVPTAGLTYLSPGPRTVPSVLEAAVDASTKVAIQDDWSVTWIEADAISVIFPVQENYSVSTSSGQVLPSGRYTLDTRRSYSLTLDSESLGADAASGAFRGDLPVKEDTHSERLDRAYWLNAEYILAGDRFLAVHPAATAEKVTAAATEEEASYTPAYVSIASQRGTLAQLGSSDVLIGSGTFTEENGELTLSRIAFSQQCAVLHITGLHATGEAAGVVNSLSGNSNTRRYLRLGLEGQGVGNRLDFDGSDAASWSVSQGEIRSLTFPLGTYDADNETYTLSDCYFAFIPDGIEAGSKMRIDLPLVQAQVVLAYEWTAKSAYQPGHVYHLRDKELAVWNREWQLVDATTEEPVDQATLALTDADGNYTGVTLGLVDPFLGRLGSERPTRLTMTCVSGDDVFTYDTEKCQLLPNFGAGEEEKTSYTGVYTLNYAYLNGKAQATVTLTAQRLLDHEMVLYDPSASDHTLADGVGVNIPDRYEVRIYDKTLGRVLTTEETADYVTITQTKMSLNGRVLYPDLFTVEGNVLSIEDRKESWVSVAVTYDGPFGQMAERFFLATHNYIDYKEEDMSFSTIATNMVACTFYESNLPSSLKYKETDTFTWDWSPGYFRQNAGGMYFAIDYLTPFMPRVTRNGADRDISEYEPYNDDRVRLHPDYYYTVEGNTIRNNSYYPQARLAPAYYYLTVSRPGCLDRQMEILVSPDLKCVDLEVDYADLNLSDVSLEKVSDYVWNLNVTVSRHTGLNSFSGYLAIRGLYKRSADLTAQLAARSYGWESGDGNAAWTLTSASFKRTEYQGTSFVSCESSWSNDFLVLFREPKSEGTSEFPLYIRTDKQTITIQVNLKTR